MADEKDPFEELQARVTELEAKASAGRVYYTDAERTQFTQNIRYRNFDAAAAIIMPSAPVEIVEGEGVQEGA